MFSFNQLGKHDVAASAMLLPVLHMLKK